MSDDETQTDDPETAAGAGADAPDQASGGGGDEAQGAAADQRQAAAYQILTQYVKDLSFENPKAPDVFLDRAYQQPEVRASVDVGTRALSERLAEVSLMVEIEARINRGEANEALVYLVELTYAGVVQVGNVPKEAVSPLLMIEVPRQLFPFARNVVAEAVRDGGFPMLTLNPYDFVQLYERKRQAMQAQQGGEGKGGESGAGENDAPELRS